MALWGNSTSDESRPKWLRENDNPGNDLNKCFADERGWVLKHPNGYEEVLVTISGLSTKLGNATIQGVYFKAKTYTAGATGTVVVNYNEKVNVTAPVTLAVGIAGTTTTVTATAAAQTGVQQVEFTFTVPTGPKTLSISGQSIPGASSTIVDTINGTASDRAFATGDVKGAGGVGAVTTISVA
jgi:hypothetical protein